MIARLSHKFAGSSVLTAVVAVAVAVAVSLICSSCCLPLLPLSVHCEDDAVDALRMTLWWSAALDRS